MAVISIKFCDICQSENPDNMTIDPTVEEVTIGWESSEQRKVFACEKHREPLQALYELGTATVRRGRKTGATAAPAAGRGAGRKRGPRSVPSVSDIDKSKTAGAGSR
jgi:hypothetical protein